MKRNEKKAEKNIQREDVNKYENDCFMNGYIGRLQKELKQMIPINNQRSKKTINNDNHFVVDILNNNNNDRQFVKHQDDVKSVANLKIVMFGVVKH